VVQRWLGRGHEVGSVAVLGGGLDHVAYEVNGEIVVRWSRGAEDVRRETELLAAVAEVFLLPVPEVVFVDPDVGALAYRKLPGVPLLGRDLDQLEWLGPPLGEALTALHGADPGRFEGLLVLDREPLAAWRDEAAAGYREIRDRLPPRPRAMVERFLEAALPAEPDRVVVCHNDLGAEHLLVDAAACRITGVIDWSDAALADPAIDLGLVFRDLGPDVLDGVLAHYGPAWRDRDRERAVFYARAALIEDLVYGWRTGARAYVEAGQRHLERTFG
jgi:aminoglycoside phosphotransferase (APT) family kinase protein